MNATPAPSRPAFGPLAAILAVSVLLRGGLAFLGGQYYHGDEGKYHRGIELYQALAAGDWARARGYAALPENAAFTWLGAALSGPHQALAALSGDGDWSDRAAITATSHWPALLLGLASGLVIFLVHRLARRLGAEPGEADLAALAAAGSVLLLQGSRHLLPYDAALAAWLAALLSGLGPRPRDQAAAGALAGLSFHLYNGYWFLAPLALAWQAAVWRRTGAGRGRALAAWAAGAAAGFGLPVLLGAALGGAAYWEALRQYRGSVRQGVFAEGWSLPAEFLLRSEPLLAALGAAAFAAAWFAAGRLPGRVRAVLALAAGMYALWLGASVGLEQFVLYGRTVRPLLPLGALAAGWALYALARGDPRRRAALVLGGIAAAALQAAPHVALRFPREVQREVFVEFGPTKRALAYSGTYAFARPVPVQRPDLALVNGQLLYPLRAFIGYPAGATLRTTPHPLALAAYQYEGHTPRERRLLRAHPPEIRLVRLAAPADVPDIPPPEQTLRPDEEPDGRDRGRR